MAGVLPVAACQAAPAKVVRTAATSIESLIVARRGGRDGVESLAVFLVTACTSMLQAAFI
jgi:hypothetical protein